ncbi:MAG: hypothetical protein SVE93_04450 [Candidatus Thermoplasmatota archaeon]|nr:hypothetical protein [Candidatus Thermoplasmatota archaeon]
MNNQPLKHKYHLEKFYTRLKDNLGKRPEDSVLIKMLDMKSNRRMNTLQESSFKASELSQSALKDLIDEGYIRMGFEEGSYVITAKGVWLFEKDAGIMDEEALIEAIDEKFFCFSEDINRKLNDREKIIILAMIAARAFSQDSIADLMDKRKVEYWGKIIKESCEKLNSMGIVATKVEEIMQQKGNEHPVSNLMRHTDTLPKKTRGMYKALGNQRYYLDLYADSSLSKEKLAYLFWRVFGDKFRLENRNAILEFCNRIAHEECAFIFDMNKHIFGMPEYDSFVKDAFEWGVINRSMWEK